ncbi:MAG TPA: universal stress protein, partial [Ktedonobacteraceae bacterium]|nr:universal stress protein [Ktedonobacteraceae bacterium]
ELRRLLVGSVTEQLLRTCRLPLFIVRPPKAVREEKQEQSGEVPLVIAGARGQTSPPASLSERE